MQIFKVGLIIHNPDEVQFKLKEGFKRNTEGRKPIALNLVNVEKLTCSDKLNLKK